MTTDVVAPPPAAEPLRPVSASERVEIIDIVRGLALFGILAANIRGFSGPAATYFLPHLFWPALHDRIAQAFIDTFVQGKFITIFAFLFGVGFAVQLERAQTRGGKFGWTYARRLSVLLLFGLIHGLLIWFGDILLVYALVGFSLLAFRKRRDKTVLIWALIGLALLPLLLVGMFVAFQLGVPMPDLPKPTPAEIATLRATFTSGSWSAINMQRMKDAVTHNWNFLPFFGWNVLGLFLLGMYAWRKQFFRPAPESLPLYRKWMWIAFAVGITGNIAITAIRWTLDPPPFPTTAASLAGGLISFVSTPALSFAYVALVILLCHDAAWRARLHHFGAVGRTALSNYLLQTIIGTLIFYNYGLGLFGIGPAILLPMTIVLYAALLMLSVWWIARHRFGPMEWVWRRLTYGRAMSEEKGVPIAAPEAAM